MPLQPKKRPAPISRKGYLGITPLSLIVYGPPGVGKTSFAAEFPNVGFIRGPKEEGVVILQEFKRIPNPRRIEEVLDWDHLLNTLDSAASWDVETVVLDSLSEFEFMCFRKHCEEDYDNNFSKEGFFAYQQGPKSAAAKLWPEMITALDRIRASGISTILIAHSQVKPRPNPAGSDYIAYSPRLEPTLWERTHTWAQCVLFYNHETQVEKDGTRKKAMKGSEARWIYTENSAVATAKNWYGLEPMMDGGNSSKEAYQAFKSAMQKAHQG